jgi:hypothetical protein
VGLAFLASSVLARFGRTGGPRAGFAVRVEGKRGGDIYCRSLCLVLWEIAGAPGGHLAVRGRRTRYGAALVVGARAGAPVPPEKN